MKGMTWLAAAGLFALATAAQAVEIGPAPTTSSVQATGPFAISSQTISGFGRPYGGATVYSPNTAGKYSIVAFCPGFTATRSSVDVMARRLASHGFIVAAMDTESTQDQPSSRATQIVAVLNDLAALNSGAAAGKVDPNRRVATGHSMGGGGTLIAATNNPSTIDAAIALAPWNSSTTNFSGDRVPTAIIGGQNDNVAPVNQHSIPFYNSMTQNEKLICIESGEDHFFPQENPADQPSSAIQISWAKRFADQDLRYSSIAATRWSACSSFASTAPF